MKKPRLIVFLFIITLIFAQFIEPVLAIDSIDLSGSVSLAKNPFDYGQPPEGLFVFIHTGSDPFYSMEIDTSNCRLDALYVYDQELNATLELAEGPICCYTATKDCVFYATESNTVYQISYAGTEKVQVYQGNRGVITDMDTYLQYLYFIESGQFLVVLDTQTGTAETVAQIPNVVSSVMISHDQIVCGTSEDVHFLVEIRSQKVVRLEGDYAASALITKAVLSAAGTTVSETPSAGIMSVYAPSAVNDISFPLDEYPAPVPDKDDFQKTYKNGDRPVPLSWFHKDGTENCSSNNCIKYRDANECQGFAMYAHDIYHHAYEPDGGYHAWFTDRHTVYKNIYFQGDENKAISFFSDLNEGALVRYDSEYNTHPNGPTEGDHAFIYVTRDSNGIWVYECNQKYEGVDQGNCGIHYQYYTYTNLTDRYASIVYYINHTFSDSYEYESGSYHKYSCTQTNQNGQSCPCYRRLQHDNLSVTLIDHMRHQSISSCCGIHVEQHTGQLSYSRYSASQHKVQATCCDGYILQNHIFINDKCKFCNYINGSVVINRAKSRNIQTVNFAE